MEKQQAYSQNALLSSLMQTPHGEISNYLPVALPAAKSDPELFAHLVAWDRTNGKVKDSLRAFPVIALRGLVAEQREFAENAVAHLLLLSPRELAKAYKFSHELTVAGENISGGHRRLFEKGLRDYLHAREANVRWWDSAALSDRHALKYLYKVSHTKPSPRAQKILFWKEYPYGSVFEAVQQLPKVDPIQAGGLIQKFSIPMEIAIGAGVNPKNEDIALAIIEGMTGNQLLNNTNMLKKIGVFTSPKLRASYDAAIERGKSDKRVNTFRATKAAQVLGEETKEAKKLVSMQTAQEKNLKGIEGDWLVIGDMSGSMQQSIDIARHVAAALASQVKGKVYLVFVSTSHRAFDVTGKSFDEVLKATQSIKAGGGTCLGLGLDYALEKNWQVQGIVVVSDGGENNHPIFAAVYKKYCEKFSCEPSVTLFHVPGDRNVFTHNMEVLNFRATTMELGASLDLYSLPQVVRSLKPGRYGLLDEIYATELLTFEKVFKKAA